MMMMMQLGLQMEIPHQVFEKDEGKKDLHIPFLFSAGSNKKNRKSN
jgi:hypothetical protein